MRNKLIEKLNEIKYWEMKKSNSESLKIKINRNFKNKDQNWHKYKMTWNHIWFFERDDVKSEAMREKRGRKRKKKKKRSSKSNIFPFVHTRLTTGKRMMQPFQHVWWHLTTKRHHICHPKSTTPLTHYRILRTFQPLLDF